MIDSPLSGLTKASIMSDEKVDLTAEANLTAETVEQELELLEVRAEAVEARREALSLVAGDDVLPLREALGASPTEAGHGDGSTDGFDMLEGILADAKRIAVDQYNLKVARAKLRAAEKGDKNGGLPPEQREALRKLCFEMEAKVEYRPESVVANFTQQLCLGCGSTHKHFDGLFIREQHRTDPKLRRMVRYPFAGGLSEDLDRLPKERAYRIEQTPLCDCCVKLTGYKAITHPWTEGI